jgi:hypothetical protein
MFVDDWHRRAPTFYLGHGPSIHEGVASRGARGFFPGFKVAAGSNTALLNEIRACGYVFSCYILAVKPNTKSPFFKLSLVFVVIFFVQDYFAGKLIVHAIKENKSTGPVALVYWLGLLWLSIAATLYYKTTRFRQSGMRQLLVFIIAPFVFAPLAALVYVALALLPTYGLVNNNGFSN